MVLEGGSIDVNGAGLLLTTEECLLSHVQARNPGTDRGAKSSRRLRDYLGRGASSGCATASRATTRTGTSTIWRASPPRTPWWWRRRRTASDANYEPLRENLAMLRAAGLRVVKLPMPQPLFFAGQRLPASYANFYIANGLVLVPTFNDPNDRVALNTLARLFPDRQVTGINCTELIWGLGALHCMTQQQPAGVEVT